MIQPDWQQAALRVRSDGRRTAAYRLLQSWYREHVLQARPGVHRGRNGAEQPVGSLLHADDVAQRPGLNFLAPDIHAYAAERAVQVQREGGTLEVGRLFHNMLSSMPLCFNLFGALRSRPEVQVAMVRDLFDRKAVAVEMIECEWTPRAPDATLGDRTAFDAAIITRRADGTRHLIGVETKYTEPFSATTYGARPSDLGKYRHAHESSGWFEVDAHDRLTASSTNQLWRNCLLAAAAERVGEVDSASVVVVAVADDRGAATAIEGVTGAMTDPTRCRSVPLAQVVASAKRVGALTGWATEFERRYLDLTPIREARCR